MFVLGVIVMILAIGFMFGCIALWFVRDWQEHTRNGE